MLFKNAKEFYYDYEQPLAAALHRIERRGILVEQTKLGALRKELQDDIKANLDEIATEIQRPVVLYKADASSDDALVLQSPQQLVKLFEGRGLKVPKNRQTGRATTSADALENMLAESGDPILAAVIQVRELGKVLTTNVEALLHKDVLYFSFRATGTETGRRSSSECFVGIGCNGQNIPKWSKWGKKYRSCLVARPGKIFMQVDQKSAEDWIINAIIADVSGVDTGIQELVLADKGGLNRHIKLAAFIFGVPESSISKNAIQYALAKRVRYGASYDMGPATMSVALAKDGKIVHKDECAVLMDRFHLAEPTIRGVYHRYIRSEIETKHRLVTPIGRSRDFLDLRPFSNNNDTIRKGYAFEPQSTVGDNTGLSIVYLELHDFATQALVVSESHDSILCEIDDSDEVIVKTATRLADAFNRTLTFPINGYQVQVPIEHEIGYDLGSMETCDFAKPDGWKNIVAGLRSRQKLIPSSTSGQELRL